MTMTRKFFKTLIRLTVTLLGLLPKIKFGGLVPYKSKNLAIVPYVNNDIELLDVKTNVEGRYLEFVFLNKPLLPLFECLRSIYYALRSNTQFRHLSNKKILIINIPQPGWGSSYRSIWL